MRLSLRDHLAGNDNMAALQYTIRKNLTNLNIVRIDRSDDDVDIVFDQQLPDIEIDRVRALVSTFASDYSVLRADNDIVAENAFCLVSNNGTGGPLVLSNNPQLVPMTNIPYSTRAGTVGPWLIQNGRIRASLAGTYKVDMSVVLESTGMVPTLICIALKVNESWVPGSQCSCKLAWRNQRNTMRHCTIVPLQEDDLLSVWLVTSGHGQVLVPGADGLFPLSLESMVASVLLQQIS